MAKQLAYEIQSHQMLHNDISLKKNRHQIFTPTVANNLNLFNHIVILVYKYQIHKIGQHNATQSLGKHNRL